MLKVFYYMESNPPLDQLVKDIYRHIYSTLYIEVILITNSVLRIQNVWKKKSDKKKKDGSHFGLSL